MQESAAVCTATRRDGRPCTAPALPSSEQQCCFAHCDSLKSARSAGGKARATVARSAKHLPPHLAPLQARLVELVDELGTGATEPDTARAIVATVGKLIDLARFAVELGEQRELTERIAALEAALEEGRHGRTYTAR